MNLRNIYRPFAIAFRSSRSDLIDSRWVSIRKCHSIITNLPHKGQTSGNLSYVQRMKFLQTLREKTGVTEEIIQKGKCLIYFKGDPLLTENFNIAWLNYSDLNLEIKPFIENAVLLGITEDSRIQFALQIATFGEELRNNILRKSDGNFTDFRLSLMVIISYLPLVFQSS